MMGKLDWSRPPRFSLRFALLAVALAATSLTWLQWRERRLRAEHDIRIVNLRGRLVYVEEFREELQRQIANSNGADVSVLQNRLVNYDAEKAELLRQIEY